jgi:hypothetical protein
VTSSGCSRASRRRSHSRRAAGRPT